MIGPQVCAVLTSFNRRDTTLASLQALERSAGRAEVALHAVLVDDGSRDGTTDAVRSRFAWVEVLRSDGSLYWCRGMHRAMAHALPQGHDYLLWLNDDTLLKPDAVAQLLGTAQARRANSAAPVIVVGSTCDAVTSRPSYGGRRQATCWWPTRLELVTPTDAPQRVATFDGNIVLLPADAAQRVGNLDPAFEHAMGDADYGLRAARSGVDLWLAPGYQGHCGENPSGGTFADRTLPLARRWRLMQDRKGLPWRSWWRFTRRHAGPVWPLCFAWPYLRVVAQGLLRRG